MADPAYIVDGVLTDGEAWVGLAHASLSLPAAVCTFTSTNDGQTGDFSQYMDFVLVYYGRTDRVSTSDAMKVTVNNDTTNGNYSMQRLYGYGGAASANATTSHGYHFGELECPAANSPANVFAAGVIHCFDVNSGKYKSNVQTSASDGWNTGGNAADNGWVHLQENTWKSQAPITEIDLKDASGPGVSRSFVVAPSGC